MTKPMMRHDIHDELLSLDNIMRQSTNIGRVVYKDDIPVELFETTSHGTLGACHDTGKKFTTPLLQIEEWTLYWGVA